MSGKPSADMTGVKYRNDKEFVDECVQIFLATSDSVLAQARGQAQGFDGISSERAVQNARLAWSAMSRARLFCIRPEHFLSIYNTADRYTNQLAGLDWSPQRRTLYETRDDMDVDLYCTLWGVTEEQAEERGLFVKDELIVPAFKGWEAFEGQRVPIKGRSPSKEGWEALRDGLSRLPKEKVTRMYQMLFEYVGFRKTADAKKDRLQLVEKAEEIKKVLYDETPEDVERLINVYEDQGLHWPFPDPLPFDSCFFSIGRRLNLSLTPSALQTRFRQDEFERMGAPDIFLVGYLVAWEGDVPFAFTVMQFGQGDGLGGINEPNKSVMGMGVAYEGGEWLQPMSLDPWIVSMMVRAVNEHKQIIQDYTPSLANRMDRKKVSKRSKQLLPLPAPFYMVNLKDELIAAPVKKPTQLPGRPVEWSHRWDVRGHECCRIERGELPIPEKLKASLKRREYRIHEGMAVTSEDLGRLMKRGIRAPGPREWVAVLSFWRDAAIRGPKDRPYVPAARVDA